MNAPKPRYGKKQVCPCGRAKRKFQALLDEHGKDSGGGKCWSPSCGQRFFAPPKQERQEQPKQLATMTRTHTYQDEAGSPLMRITVLKSQSGEKCAFAERWDSTAWIKGAAGVRRVPYRLPEVLERIALGGTVVVVEGEKDADRADTIGLTATCNPFGAGKWTDEMSSMFNDARVVVIPDLDDAGWAHAREVERSLINAGTAAVGVLDLRTLMLDLPEKSDLSDYLDRGGDPEALRTAIERTVSRADEDNAHETDIPEVPPLDWETLPAPLAQLVRPIEDPRQRAALLTAAVTVIGGAIPGVHTMYHGQRYSPSLYTFVFGPPGSGKGSIGPAEHLIRGIDMHIRQENVDALASFKAGLAQWKASEQKNGRAAPEKPQRKMFLVPADSTGPVLIRAICTNPAVVLFDSEADSLQCALRTETGDASSALRKCWQGEPVSQARVADDLLVHTYRPHLAMVLSGTPDQIGTLVRHVESGLTSRFCFVEFPTQVTFRDPFRIGSDDVRLIAEALQEPIRKLWAWVSERCESNDFVVELSTKQQQRLVEHFKARFEDRVEAADQGTTLRSGIVAVRIITVLTVVRRWFELQRLEHLMLASDQDFNLGLELAEFLRRGTDRVITLLSSRTAASKTRPSARPSQRWFDQLPDVFSTNVALDLGRAVGIGRSTVHAALKQEIRFEKIRHGMYRKRVPSMSRGP